MAGPGSDRSRPAAVERALRFILDPGSDSFEAVARDVFAFQYEHNPPFRRLCRYRGVDPASLQGWERIPAVPTAAFREARLACGEPARIFVTSGTSGGEDRRGRHFLPGTSLYEASWEEPFRRHVLKGASRARLLSFIPSPRWLPESSLSWMTARALERFGDDGSVWVFDGRRDPEDILTGCIRSDTPVVILGTALALAGVLEAMEAGRRSLPLPEGSRIMDTGGFKGRRRSVTRKTLLGLYRDRLGVPPGNVVGEYGMTELSSQAYEILHHGQRIYVGPPWMRTRVVDPETLDEVEEGERGLLAHYDLANAWTVSGVLTEDLGRRAGPGFLVEGRAEGAALRGCSLATEEVLGS